jgi:hypothetical protein
MTTCRALLQAAIRAAGGDSLCNSEQECGCELDDLSPCPECLHLDDCRVARKIKSEPDSPEMFAFGPGYYQVI